MDLENKTIVIGGQARLPKDLGAGGIFQVVAEVEVETGKVLDVEFSPSSPIVSRKLKAWLAGASVSDGLGPVLEVIEQQFIHKAKKAVLTAVKDLGREFKEFKNRHLGQNSPED